MHQNRLSPDSDATLHNRIVQMSPVLEGCGNAQTVMNGNSSRYVFPFTWCNALTSPSLSQQCLMHLHIPPIAIFQLPA